jgi:hypothetical protein
MPSPPPIVVDILNGVIKWRRSRVALKRVLDSRSATDSQKAAAKRAYQEASDRLETLGEKLEETARGKTLRRKGTPLPWREMFSGLASLIQIADNVANNIATVQQGLDGAQQPPKPKPPRNRAAGTVNEDGSINAEVVDDG